MMRPRKNLILAEYLPDELTTEAGITLLSCSSVGKIHSRVLVHATGPDVTGDIAEGSIVWVQGQGSGIKVDDNLYLISDEICEMVEIEE